MVRADPQRQLSNSHHWDEEQKCRRTRDGQLEFSNGDGGIAALHNGLQQDGQADLAGGVARWTAASGQNDPAGGRARWTAAGGQNDLAGAVTRWTAAGGQNELVVGGAPARGLVAGGQNQEVSALARVVQSALSISALDSRAGIG